MSDRVTRRGFIKAAVLAVGALTSADLVAACGQGGQPATATTKPAVPAATKPAAPANVAPTTGAASTTQAAGFDWKRFSGANIRLLAIHNPTIDLWPKRIQEFEQLTGIKVTFDLLELNAMKSKLGVEMMGGATDLDMFLTWPKQEGLKFLRAGWYEVLDDKYLKDPTMASPDLDLADFMESSLEGSKIDGKLIGLPNGVAYSLLCYRKDLFQAAGLNVPETWDDFEAAAKKLHNPSGQVYGAAYRGQANAAAGIMRVWAASYGGNWFTSNGDPDFASDENLKAWDVESRVLRLYGPPGAISLDMNTAPEMFAQGKAAMIIEPQTNMTGIFDKSTSRVLDKVGFAVTPAGPKGHTPILFNAALAISSRSKNKGAAWFFIQWAMNKANSLELAMSGITPSRKSTLQEAKFKDGPAKEQPEWWKIFSDTDKVAVADWLPPMVAAQEARDVYGKIIEAGIQGQDIKAAALEVNKEMKDLMTKTQ